MPENLPTLQPPATNGALDHAALATEARPSPGGFKRPRTRLKVTFFLSDSAASLANVFVIWPATLIYVALRAPVSTMTTLAFAAALPAVRTYSSLFESTGVGARVMPRVVKSLNRARYALPLLVFAIVALSSSPTHRDFPETASTDGPNSLNFCGQVYGPEAVTPVNLHLYGTWERGSPSAPPPA